MSYVVRPEVIQRAVEGIAQEARRRPEKTEMSGGDGVLEYRIPTALVVNAVRGHGVSLKDDEYWRDQARRVPGCEVKYVPRNPRVGGRGLPGKVRTRFGVAARTVYG